jgi:hypothetical protein
MIKYYFVEATTQYDGFDFSNCSRLIMSQALTKVQADRFAKAQFVHEGSGEELADVRFREITKEEYSILEKLGI